MTNWSQDNADIRLTAIGDAIGLASDEALERVNQKVQGTIELKKSLRKEGVSPELANKVLLSKDSAVINQQVKLSSLITRPHITIEDVLEMSVVSKQLANELSSLHPDIINQTEIVLKYEGYIDREEDVAKKMNRMEHLSIPEGIDYSVMLSLSTESRQKLAKIQPVTIGQASRVSGVSPSDIAVLLIHLGR